MSKYFLINYSLQALDAVLYSIPQCRQYGLLTQYGN